MACVIESEGARPLNCVAHITTLGRWTAQVERTTSIKSEELIRQTLGEKRTFMKTILYSSIVQKPYCKGAVIRKDFPGFKEDYLVLHCLIRIFNPRTFIEIGTSVGTGTNVICNAMNGRKVFSIDVPPGTNPATLYPGGEDGHPDVAGKNCRFPYVQLFGDSCSYDYSPYLPLEGWFIDAKHDYEHCRKDTLNAINCEAKLIVWHDMQIDGVAKAANEVDDTKRYDSFRVTDTRIGYATRRALL